MPTEHINEKENLKSGTIKLNKAIDQANKAEVDSTNAVSTANEAKQQSQAAETKSDFTQSQLDLVTGASTIDPAVEQMKMDTEGVTHSSPDARLRSDYNKVVAKFSEIPNVTTYVTDESVGSSVGVALPFSIDYFRKKQNLLMSNSFKSIRNNIATTVCCQGDSTTYGHDTVSSDRRPANSDPTLDQSQTYTYTQATISYPEALQEYVNRVGLNINIINRGFSGDTVSTSYARWDTPSGAQLTFMMFGLNDFGGSIETFRDTYIKLISREILRGSAVVLLTPFKTKQPRKEIDSLTNVIYDLGKMFGVPIIEMDRMMDNYSASIHSDDFHLNGAGYRMIGARLTSLLIGEGCNRPNRVKSGDKILTRELTDNCIFMGGSGYDSNGAMDTPDEIYNGLGISCKLPNLNSRIYYSFYTEEDDLIIIPDLFKSGISTAEVELDFDSIKPKNSLSAAKDGTNTSNSNGLVTKFTVDNTSVFTKRSLSGISDQRYIHVAKKGWHTLSITKTVGDGTWWVRGLEVLSYEDYKRMFQKGYYSFPVDLNISTTEIDIFDLCNALNIDPINTTSTQGYWDSVACSITVHNYDHSIRQYMFNLSNINYSTDWSLSSGEVIYPLPGGSIAYRSPTAVSFDTTTKKLAITWSGSISKKARAVIRVA